jgi:hypothetical protein
LSVYHIISHPSPSARLMDVNSYKSQKVVAETQL